MGEKSKKLRQIIDAKRAVLAPGAANALFARIIEDLDYECCYVTGAGIANMSLGAPDIGLTTLSEIENSVARISDAVNIPLIVDADTGFGNAVNTWRAIRLLEKAGASAIQIEDQEFPKRCGHFNGKSVVPMSEMIAKIHAAKDAQRKSDTILIARTDALASDGINAALERAQAYIEAGADMTFVEAPRDKKQMNMIAALKVPQIANIVFGGKTPPLKQDELEQMGFSIVLYANAALQAAVKSSHEVLGALKKDGGLENVAYKLASFEERQNSVAKYFWDDLELKYKEL